MLDRADVIPQEVSGLPLVERRDSAIRPASTALSEDIRTGPLSPASQTNNPYRELLKNGSWQFLIDAPHTVSAPLPAVGDVLASSPVNSFRITSQSNPISTHQLPSCEDFSSSLASREINLLKDEVGVLKADIAAISRRPAVFPSELQPQFGQELKRIKRNFSCARSSA